MSDDRAFFRSPYAKAVFWFVRIGFLAVGLLFLCLSAAMISDTLLGTSFGYEPAQLPLGIVGVAGCAAGWFFIGAIEKRLRSGVWRA